MVALLKCESFNSSFGPINLSGDRCLILLPEVVVNHSGTHAKNKVVRLVSRKAEIKCYAVAIRVCNISVYKYIFIYYVIFHSENDNNNKLHHPIFKNLLLNVFFKH